MSACGCLRGGGCSGSSSGCRSPSDAAKTPGLMILLPLLPFPGGPALRPRARAALPCSRRRGRRRGGGGSGVSSRGKRRRNHTSGTSIIRFSNSQSRVLLGARGRRRAAAGSSGQLCLRGPYPGRPRSALSPPPRPPLRRLWLAGLAVATSLPRSSEVRLVCGAG